jgi:hypothetical protein
MSRKCVGGLSPPRGTVEPIPELPATGQTPACKCGAPFIGQRCRRGHQAPKALGAQGIRLVHGAYAESSLESLSALGAIGEKRAALRVHFGGEPSVLEEDLAADYARLDVLIETVSANVAHKGVITTRGRTRSTVTLLMQLMQQRQRLAALLGLQRREKELSLDDWISQDASAGTGHETGEPS